jgi:hypothetical protein
VEAAILYASPKEGAPAVSAINLVKMRVITTRWRCGIKNYTAQFAPFTALSGHMTENELNKSCRAVNYVSEYGDRQIFQKSLRQNYYGY